MEALSFHKEWPKPQHEGQEYPVHSCCFPVCFQGKLQGTRGDWSLHITQWKNQCQSYRAAGSHTAAWIRSYTDLKNCPPFQTFWKAKTEYGVELCSNHQRYSIPTTPNQQGNSPTLFPADNHSRFCNAADLPSSPLVLKPSVCNFTCWGLGEPDSLEFPPTELSATASGLY